MRDLRFEGRARRLGDRVNTDYIIASRRKKETLDPQELKHWLLEGVDPNFATSLEPGDVLVAGEAFGCGSAMEVAVTVVRAAGIPAVLADSFARSYFRNAVNNGLLPIECDTSGIADGDWLTVEVAPGAVTVNVHRATAPSASNSPVADEDRLPPEDDSPPLRRSVAARPFPPFVLDILTAGGLAPYLRERGGFDTSRSTETRGS